ncbi:HEAT repeat domain-containing protein [Leptothermofonsia sp. ETS-13]|uniref:HEAT repeat domain-containing protein n=1 Tax=Leptothermofonsia sp. ETS-13 TaxID=3035696 RepID=UPI003BA0AA97
MSNFLEQAQKAAQQGDWLRLSQFLQQWLLTEPNVPLLEADTRQGLALALMVLETGDFQARWDVAKVFPALGEAAIAPLIDLLQDDEADLESRWFAARILGEFDNPDTVQALIAILQNAEDEELSMIAAEALANLGASAICALTSLLANEDTRFLAVQSLSQIRRSETIAPLLSVVNDPQPGIRAMAIDALGSFHDPRIPPLLLQALTDPAAIVRRNAVASLGVRSDLINELDLVSPLSDRLWDLNLDVCQQTAIALGRIGTDAAIDRLFRVLTSPHTPLPLQIETIRALGWAETEKALECLQQSLITLDPSHTPVEVFQEMVTILGRWSNPNLKPHAAAILINLVNSTHPITTHPKIKQTIALSLGHLGQLVAIEPLSQLLADEDIGVQLHAIAALKSLDFQTSLQHLKTLARQNNLSEAMKRGVAIALQEWKGEMGG